MSDRKEFMLDVQQGGGVPVTQFCELTNAIAGAPIGKLRVTVEPYPEESPKEYRLLAYGRDKHFLEALAEFLQNVGSISGAMVIDRSDHEAPRRSAENCANAQEIGLKDGPSQLVHCGECHDINEGYKFLPNWKPRPSKDGGCL